jgi:hypothetical protein
LEESVTSIFGLVEEPKKETNMNQVAVDTYFTLVSFLGYSNMKMDATCFSEMLDY